MDITELLERAVVDVVPAERRPTEAVLRLAESRQLGSRIRKALAGLVGVAVIGGGVAVVATGGEDDGDRDTEPPRPLTLQVDLPAGWSEVTAPTTIDCTSQIQPRTVYRDALIGDLGSCGESGPTVTGPSLLVGRLDPEVAEQVRTTGVAVLAAGTAGYVVGFDAVSSFGVFLPVGSDRDVAYAVLAPHAAGDRPAYGEPYNVVPVPNLPAELVDLVSKVRAAGDVPRGLALPDEVSGVELQTEALNVGAAPGARVSSPDGVAAVLAELEPAPEGTEPCGDPVAGRTFWLEDAKTSRWSRLDVLVDADGCRTAVSELGGTRVLSGDPVAAAGAASSPVQAPVAPDAQVVTAHGLSISVPEGWQVVRDTTVDPCRLTGPAVVVADELAPSCYASFAARPTPPFAWLTPKHIEQGTYVDDPLKAEDGTLPLDWSQRLVDVTPRLMMDGFLGLPDGAAGRVLVVGLEREPSRPLRASVRIG
jgi:hypothetical protein